MTAREKLNELKEKWGFSTDIELAEKLEISKYGIDNWVKRNKIPEKWMLKIAQMDDKNSSNDLVTINLYEDVRASAGYGAFNTNIIPKPMEFDKNFLRHFFNLSSFSDIDIIRVTGDSMLPHIQDGEYVLVQREIQARNGDTVIACFDGELYIKRFKKISPLEKWFKLESDNKDYPNIDIDTEDKLEACSIVAIVKSKIKIY